jgi:tetratricopeptide (TPR) repeat protein
MQRADNPDLPAMRGDADTSLQQRLEAAARMVQGGQLEGALSAYRGVLAVRPDLPRVHANLGFVLSALDRHVEAGPHFRRMLDAHPCEVPAWLGLATSLQKQARLGEAEVALRQALALKPDCVPAMLGLGICVRSQSRLDEAREWFEHAARTDPACVDAYYLLSTLRHFRHGDPMIARCEALQARVAAMPALQQVRHGFALGKMYEDAGRFDDAFAAYANGNRARASLFVLDESDEDGLLRRTCEVFDRAFLSGAPSHAATSDRVPVFIVGMPRSGTTLIEQILATLPGVHGAGESSDLWDVLLERIGTPDRWPEAAHGFSTAAWLELGDAYMQRAWQRAPQATHVVNKLPLNYRHVGAIRLMLPQARIIHAQRDPMDVCWSCYTRLFDGDNLAYTYDLGSLGRYYARYARQVRHWHAALPPGSMLDVRYEDIVADTEGVAREMLAFLGLQWDTRCLEFHRNTRVVDTASRAQVRRPIYASSVGRWKKFEPHLRELLELVADFR